MIAGAQHGATASSRRGVGILTGRISAKYEPDRLRGPWVEQGAEQVRQESSVELTEDIIVLFF